jgi:hypothetical protein
MFSLLDIQVKWVLNSLALWKKKKINHFFILIDKLMHLLSLSRGIKIKNQLFLVTIMVTTTYCALYLNPNDRH